MTSGRRLGAAVCAVHERENVGERLADRLGGGQGEQGGGLGIHGDDRAAGVGHDDAFGDGAEGGGDEFGRRGAGAGAEAGEGDDVAGGADQLAAPAELALVADEDGDAFAATVAQFEGAAAFARLRRGGAEELGEAGVVELSTLVGYFAMVSWVMNVARTPSRPTAEAAPLPSHPL